MRAMRPLSGFTVIELVVILVLVGALALFAAPRLNLQGFDDYSFRQELVNGLRYARKVASGSRCEVLADATGDRLALFLRAGGTDTECGGGGFTEPLRHPVRGDDFVVTARREAGIASGGTVVFTAGGGADSELVVELAGGRTIRVEADTGFVDG